MKTVRKKLLVTPPVKEKLVLSLTRCLCCVWFPFFWRCQSCVATQTPKKSSAKKFEYLTTTPSSPNPIMQTRNLEYIKIFWSFENENAFNEFRKRKITFVKVKKRNFKIKFQNPLFSVKLNFIVHNSAFNASFQFLSIILKNSFKCTNTFLYL
jgi:hypothetical protein